jgi:lipopolysaccharide export system permease protein
MLQYQSYIFKNLMHTTLLVTLGLTGIVWLMQALRLVDFIVNQGIPISMFLKLSLLLMPSLLMMVLPVALCVATIFLYHRLKAESELVVLQSAGLSRIQLAMPALLSALVAVMIGYVISAIILPISSREFREMQFFLRNNYVSVLLQEGVFSSPVNGLTVYVREREGDNMFKGILVHDNRNTTAQITMMAEKASLENTTQGPRFLLSKGNRQELKDGNISFLEFDSYMLDIGVYTSATNDKKPDSQEQSLWVLFSKTPEQSENMKAFLKERAEAHQRVLWPALSLTLSTIVVALTLSGEFNRRQRWQRNALISSVCGLLLLAMVGMRGAMSSQAYWVPIAYALLIIPCVVACMFLFSASYRNHLHPFRRVA